MKDIRQKLEPIEKELNRLVGIVDEETQDDDETAKVYKEFNPSITPFRTRLNLLYKMEQRKNMKSDEQHQLNYMKVKDKALNIIKLMIHGFHM